MADLCRHGHKYQCMPALGRPICAGRGRLPAGQHDRQCRRARQHRNDDPHAGPARPDPERPGPFGRPGRLRHLRIRPDRRDGALHPRRPPEPTPPEGCGPALTPGSPACAGSAGRPAPWRERSHREPGPRARGLLRRRRYTRPGAGGRRGLLGPLGIRPGRGRPVPVHGRLPVPVPERAGRGGAGGGRAGSERRRGARNGAGDV